MLKVRNLSVGYGKRTVLDGLDVSFEKGRLTSVIGVNGSGKSTLLKATVGILPHTCGEISVDGTDISVLKRNELAQRISYLSQGRDVPDMTVAQMVLHGRFPHLGYPRRYTENDRAIALSAMERVGISALSDTPIANLSGGIRQSVYVAMALAQSSEYILLDEPTTYLDISHQIELISLLCELKNEGKGIVTVMHDLPMAFRFSDTVAVLDGGRIALVGTPVEIYESGVIKELFGVSLRRTERNGFCLDF